MDATNCIYSHVLHKCVDLFITQQIPQLSGHQMSVLQFNSDINYLELTLHRLRAQSHKANLPSPTHTHTLQMPIKSPRPPIFLTDCYKSVWSFARMIHRTQENALPTITSLLSKIQHRNSQVEGIKDKVRGKGMEFSCPL